MSRSKKSSNDPYALYRSDVERDRNAAAESLRLKVYERIKPGHGGLTDPDAAQDAVRGILRDKKVFNLETPEGRRAWRDAAGEHLERVIFEDGLVWLENYAQERVDAAVLAMTSVGAIVERPYKVEVHPQLREVHWNIPEDGPRAE